MGGTGRGLRRTAAALAVATTLAGLAAAPASAETWTGTAGNDKHIGTDSADVLRGADGADELHGRKGKDTLYGGNGHDELYGENGADVLRGGRGNDELYGGPGADELHADDMQKDTVICGDGGGDVAYVDYKDFVGATCERRVYHEVTYADLTAVFGARVGDESTVRAGLAGLNRQMRVGKIDRNAKRVSAFLATLVNESNVMYDRDQIGSSSTYRGRGFIQLTGEANYRAAGNALGVDLVASPNKAKELAWSAKIACWYWYDNRHVNGAADRMDMGAVSRLIGYAASPSEDRERCEDFKRAMKYLTGTRPADGEVTCLRH
ncbi:hypothetical protein JQN72_13995 [Phycicoccus sp. CSK15P-2]|uniref:glycoside hydrolase family 19 protein n=1 Tax=Phycicoccus sp. CSK15P-2 TaxID=2807627 RepID=UPI001951FAE9|nr:glycoside hydrolase family 19 protein [Phycicoccus sp. CSK15P-2]MBM6405353.1 hypothetical protein [Phycicoccus sp. CSK15P-2]